MNEDCDFFLLIFHNGINNSPMTIQCDKRMGHKDNHKTQTPTVNCPIVGLWCQSPVWQGYHD